MRFSTQGIALSASIEGQRSLPLVRVESSVGYGPLGVVKTGKEDTVGLAKSVGHHRAVGDLKIERCADQALGHLK